MEMLNKNQIEQFLQIEREVVCSADHIENSNYGNFWGEVEGLYTITLTTSMTTSILGGK
ncbi:hypothetical protein SAMN05660226_03624 [Parapedobacter luteus]|uniref:Uncharacterized protein n=1 Tax=Parapedobacter luteus TaxID=623280 RepID=A0A1T5EXT0_9SPHI|nr:hypothetical protein SAMN05660226_03624 [Parapedobacter luteus]